MVAWVRVYACLGATYLFYLPILVYCFHLFRSKHYEPIIVKRNIFLHILLNICVLCMVCISRPLRLFTVETNILPIFYSEAILTVLVLDFSNYVIIIKYSQNHTILFI